MVSVSRSSTPTPARLLRVLAKIATILTGLVFIFSGLIKLNDPVGTRIKLEEYFEVFAADLPALTSLFHGLAAVALPLALLVCVAEVVLGVALLIRFRLPLTSWLVLLLIVFFTFLTFYSAQFNKVTDCGCFGDAIKLAPWTSFTKDVVLLVLSLLIFSQRHRLMPWYRPRKGAGIVALTTVLSLALGLYAVWFLPPLDLLAYREGNHLPALMKPADTLRYAYDYTFEKGGKEYHFDKYQMDSTYTYRAMQQTLLNPEALPKITDYRLTEPQASSPEQADATARSLEGNKLLFVIENVEKASPAASRKLAELAKALKGSEVEVMVLTASNETATESYRHEYNLAAPYYFADATVLKTMIRTNPGVLLLQNGTVLAKWSNHALPGAAKVKTYLESAPSG